MPRRRDPIAARSAARLRSYATIGALAALCLAFQVPAALGYGQDGHRVIGALAESLLDGAPAMAHVRRLLPDMPLADATVWADCARGTSVAAGAVCTRLAAGAAVREEMRAFAAAYPDHPRWHYTNIPFQQSGYAAGDAGTDPADLVAILSECIATLRSGRPGPHRLSPRIALLVLVHLVGDIHQPLHVGDGYLDASDAWIDPETAARPPAFGIGTSIGDTRGGNLLRLSSGRNLHMLWDTDAVSDALRKAGVDDPTVFAGGLIESVRPDDPATAGLPETWPERWAADILPDARAAYERVQVRARVATVGSAATEWPITLGRNYRPWARSVVTTSLTRAGARLAMLLKALWPR